VALQFWPLGHVPHCTTPPQPLDAVPHICPAGQVLVGVQPQALGLPPPPHVWGAMQVPQLIVPPQPLEAVPQVCPAGQVVAAVQPQLFG
jgi:hypothetical protein